MQFVEAVEVHREWLRSRLDRYGDDVRGRLLAGIFFPPNAYVLGQRARRVAAAAFERAMEPVDLLAAPTLPTLPPRIGEEAAVLTYQLLVLLEATGTPLAAVLDVLASRFGIGGLEVKAWRKKVCAA